MDHIWNHSQINKYEGSLMENPVSLEEYSMAKHTPFGTVYRDDISESKSNIREQKLKELGI